MPLPCSIVSMFESCHPMKGYNCHFSPWKASPKSPVLQNASGALLGGGLLEPMRLVALGSVSNEFKSHQRFSQRVKMTNEMMFPILNRNVMPTAGKLIARPTRRPFSGHNATVAARGPFGQQWPRQMEGPGKNSRAGQMTMKILRIAWTQKFF